MRKNQRTRLACAVLCLLLATCGITPLRAQQPEQKQQDEQEEVLRLDTDLVQVRAVVTDRKGHAVEGLNRDEFEIFEEERPQQTAHARINRARRTVITTWSRA